MHRLMVKDLFPKHRIPSYFKNESTELHFWDFRGNGAKAIGTIRWLADFL